METLSHVVEGLMLLRDLVTVMCAHEDNAGLSVVQPRGGSLNGSVLLAVLIPSLQSCTLA